jgi:hypothetical protein
MTPRQLAQSYSELMTWGGKMCADRAAIGREIEEMKAKAGRNDNAGQDEF